MDLINCLNSPMALYVEDLTEHPLELEKRRKSAQKAVQESPASFLVGSMESVSQKIAHLEQHLRNFCTDDLVIESPEIYRALAQAEHFTPWDKLKEQRTQIEKMNKEYDKEMQIFTQRYQQSMVKTEFEEYPKTEESIQKEIKPKPKLVELYQFPGFSSHSPLPLPHEISLNSIIEKVVSAHRITGAKICPMRTLNRLLHTPVTQKILLDCYWWIFLHRYKPDTECQRKLFDRIAQNYIQLLTFCQGSYYGDAFLNVFPSVLSQAIYCSFCFTFPQSLHQFQSDDFKAELCSLLWQWIGGIRPIPEVYNTWDFVTLEPKDDAANDKVKQKKDSGAAWFGLLNAEEHNGVSTTFGFRPRKYSVFKPSAKNSSAVNQTFLQSKGMGFSFSNKHLKLIPESEERETGKLKTEMRFSKKLTDIESQPACHTPDFIHMLFNLSGHSPLVQYYLEHQKAHLKAGVNILVRRTEIQKQIPYPLLKH
ncbi:protein FAM227A [Leptodactylus fuscus]|uniref:protein FAM227A n=1 Tax=Leptodactylus fuscus TaxID=238119 RepID=UPI003F4F0B4D